MIEKINIQKILASADCLYDSAAVEQALDQMAEAITLQCADKNPLILCVMIGALIPLGHLLTRLSFPLEVDYIHVTRYQSTTRGGDLHWLMTPRKTLEDRTVLIFDDIMDGGLTLSAIIDYCKQMGAKEVLSGVLVNKIREREPGVHFTPDFVGVHTENRYLFGYGLDYQEYLRNAPGIYAVAKEFE